MLNIHKKILTDEAMHPLAVQIDYSDWLKIEQLLSKVQNTADKKPELSALGRIQQQVKSYISAERNLADELIAERRREAEHE